MLSQKNELLSKWQLNDRPSQVDRLQVTMFSRTVFTRSYSVGNLPNNLYGVTSDHSIFLFSCTPSPQPTPTLPHSQAHFSLFLRMGFRLGRKQLCSVTSKRSAGMRALLGSCLHTDSSKRLQVTSTRPQVFFLYHMASPDRLG